MNHRRSFTATTSKTWFPNFRHMMLDPKVVCRLRSNPSGFFFADWIRWLLSVKKRGSFRPCCCCWRYCTFKKCRGFISAFSARFITNRKRARKKFISNHLESWAKKRTPPKVKLNLQSHFCDYLTLCCLPFFAGHLEEAIRFRELRSSFWLWCLQWLSISGYLFGWIGRWKEFEKWGFLAEWLFMPPI